MHRSVQIDERVRRGMPRAGPRNIPGALLGATYLVACAAVAAAMPSASPQVGLAITAESDSARLVAIGNGRTMYLACRGSGSPTVILVSGLGERADNWDLTTDPSTSTDAVFPQVARFTRVCAYDRPGTETTTASGREGSRSTSVPQPTSGSAAAADLAAMLAASGEHGPYVFVGHSYGGDIVRLYAAANPGRVAGLVLVDALSEDLPSRLTPQQSADLERLNSPTSQGRPPNAEQFEFDVVFPELRAIKSSPGVPVVILTADRPVLSGADVASGQLPSFVTQAFVDALWSAQLAAQDDLAKRFPGAEHVTETNSQHYIHVEQPQLVVDAIRRVAAQVDSTPRSR